LQVALLAANMASNPATSLKVLSAPHTGKGAAAAAAAAAASGGSEENKAEVDPEDVRGRRLRYDNSNNNRRSRRMLVA
jgi:hypothetical protein